MKHRYDGTWVGLSSVLAWVVLMAAAHGQEPSTIWEKHPWARFGVGSWKMVRVYNESINEAGQVESTSTTDTKTTLTGVSDVDYTIRIDVVVEVAGRRFNAEPKILRQGFNGEANGQSVELQTIGPGEFVIDGRKYPVEVRKVVINGDELLRVSWVHYSDRVLPHVLKRETKAVYASDGKPNFDSLLEVVAVDMPYRVLSELKLVSHQKTVQRKADGSSTMTMEVQCADVPGGVIANSVKEVSATGRVTSRSTLELKEYQVVPVTAEPVNPSTGRRRIFHRARTRTGG